MPSFSKYAAGAWIIIQTSSDYGEDELDEMYESFDEADKICKKLNENASHGAKYHVKYQEWEIG